MRIILIYIYTNFYLHLNYRLLPPQQTPMIINRKPTTLPIMCTYYLI